MNPWLVVPTLGNRDASLVPLLRDAGMPSVVIWTGDVGMTSYVTQKLARASLRDGSMNIQQWWNRGIDFAVRQGADVVVVVNDDVEAAPGALLELAGWIESGEGAAPMLVWPGTPEHAAGRVTDITGWCFALDPTRIRPDESFLWWWGDNDLELRAYAMGGPAGALGVKVPGIRHLRTDFRYDRDVSDLIEADRVTFTRRYPALMGGWK